jgi:hypothetical protein
MDKFFIERLWRSLKHKDVHPKGYADGSGLNEGLADWSAFYNNPSPGAQPSHPDSGLTQRRRRPLVLLY